MSRYARSHGPFTTDEVATRLGLGVSVVRLTLQRLAAQGRVLDGEFRPSGSGTEWCDAEVLRKLRRRSLARLRKEIEPVEQEALGRFGTAWQHVSGKRGLRGIDGLLVAIDQLAGCAVPASALEPLVLAARVRDYEPAMLDELTASGEVLWAGHGPLGTSDGWVSLHLADQAPLTLPEPTPLDHSDVADAVLESLAGGGAWFFRQLAQQVAAAGVSATDEVLSTTLWQLVWSGRVSGDTLTPLRALARSGGTAHRTRKTPARPRLGSTTGSAGRLRATTARTGPPETAGRWALLPELDTDPTRRAHAAAEHLLDRHGVVTRGAVASERVPGGFAAVYKVLAAFEDSGRCRRGYFVSGLGAAQFGTVGAIDRLRTFTDPATGPDAAPDAEVVAVTLAATDPANPYGAALAWPDRSGGEEGSAGHRPGRKAGALVVLVDGQLALYVERGGKTLLTFTDDPELLGLAARSLAEAAGRGALGRMTVERAEGEQLLGSGTTPLRTALTEAGFVSTPRGLRLSPDRRR